LALAQGEYITILNSDDYFLPGRLRILVNVLTITNGRFAFSKVEHIDSLGQTHPYQAAYLRQINEAAQFPTLNFELLRNNIAVTTGNFFFHRSLYEEIGGFAPYVTCHDWDYLLRVLLIEEPLFVNEPLLAYRIHDQGTLQTNLQRVETEIEQLMVNYFEKVGSAKNPLAPGPVGWGAYWLFFRSNYVDRISVLPRVRDQLDLLQTAMEAVDFKTLADPVDLDLTQINLQNLSPQNTKSNNKHPHLLLVLPWMVMGGAERFTLNLMDQLRERGWEISILCTTPSENGWKAEFQKRTQKIFILPDILPVKEYLRFFRYWIEFGEVDGLLLQGSLEGYRFMPALKRLYPTLPILDYLHFVTEDWMDGGFPKLSVLYRDGLDLTITSCRQVKDWMVGQGAAANLLRISPIGVDAARWKPGAEARMRVRQNLGLGQAEVVLVYAARLEQQKQPLVFADTVRLLTEQGVAFRALVAGEGSLRSELENYIQQQGLDERILLLGEVSDEDMPDLLAAGDIFFLPSQNEGISSAIYEAMACGLPVVGADVGGQAELVTPDCGILLPVIPPEQQPAGYAGILHPLITDQHRRQEMQISCRQRIKRGFTLSHMGDQINAILNDVIEHIRFNPPVSDGISPEARFLRGTQHVVEYLQARNEWHKSNQQIKELSMRHEALMAKYSALVSPKPASYWFYLWIRQLFLPVFTKLKNNCFGRNLMRFQKWIKRRWIQK
jgi:glycosyltransferase involved in cell wall biosynthesis